jgi:cytochrome P450
MLHATTLPTARTVSELPAPRALPVIGNLHQIELEHFHEQLEQWCDELGPIFKIRMGMRDVVCISDTATINEMLRERPSMYRRVRSIESITSEMNIKGVFSAEGDEWKLQRKVVALALNSAHINRFFPKLFATTENLERHWRKLASDNTGVELCRNVMRYTVDVTTQLAFGIDVDTIGTDGPVVQQHLDKVFPTLHRRINAPFPYWRYFRLPSDRALDRSLKAIEETVNEIIIECRQRMENNPELYTSPTNFLEAIISAQVSESGSNFTDKQIYANVLTLLLAGEDTTANTIAWACKYFIDYPEHFARAREEVDDLLGSNGIPTSPEQLKEFPFIEAFVNETMRLKPVGPIAPMETNEVVELLGCQVPAGTSIFGLLRHIAVDQRNFEHAKEFNPERWLVKRDSASSSHDTSAFLPFGSGPRFCPGRNLALTEIKMVIAMLCKNFDISLANPDVPVQEKLAFAMMPKNLNVKFAQRTTAN